MKSAILLNPQWQGGNDRNTYDAAKEIQAKYLVDCHLLEVPVDLTVSKLSIENDILGYASIAKQQETAYDLLKKENASKVFTVGGGCDADVSPVLYLNEIYDGDMVLVYFDAHGDINAPWESETHLYYGMPVRVMLGDCKDAFPSLKGKTLIHDQVIHAGAGDLDETEIEYIKDHGITQIGVGERSESEIMHAVRNTGKTNVYIHLDLDALDPTAFPSTPVPVAGGFAFEQIVNILQLLKQEYNVVGFGLYEYKAENEKNSKLEKFIEYGKSIVGRCDVRSVLY